MDSSNLSLDKLFITDSKIDLNTDYNNYDLPVDTSLNFTFLIDHIKSVAENGTEAKSSFAKIVLKEFENSPELHGKIKDEKVTEKYEDLIKNMMMFVFPDAFMEVQTYAAFSPYAKEPFYSTSNFKKLNFAWNENLLKGKGQLNIDDASFIIGKAVSTYVGILGKFYNVKLNMEFPIVFKVMDPSTGLDKYYKMNGAAEFVDIIAKKKIKKLTNEDIDNIKKNLYNLEYVNSILEPQNFEYTGVLTMNAINISDTEILSSIRKDLIEKNTITSFSGFLRLQHKVKSLLKCPNLLLGLTVYPGSTEKLFEYGQKIGNSFLMNDNCLLRLGSIKQSIYEMVLNSRKAIIIDDLSKYPDRSAIEDEILNQGIKNILVAPLILEDKIAGLIEIGSPGPGMINMINSLKLRDLLPLFAMAVDRSNEEINNRVSAIIKEKCTAIHPSLEWKFQKAALNFLKNERNGINTEMEEIVFHNVYPLYGLSDIRNSSQIRNQAIREDLIENLELAGEVILAAKKFKDLKVFDEINFRIEKKINSLKFGIGSGDEAEIMKFLNKKIIPLFDHIKNYNEEVKTSIEKYYLSIHDDLMLVYKRRKEYDESSMKITNFIASYLDEEQKYIQSIFPHYFERYKTDGVDHNIYLGESLVEDKKFNMIYLKNIRMWQLMMMCGIVRKLEDITKELSVPLEAAHLILVQDNPLSIRFRYDEKKFDVDGAYNIRYEIMKKRIDKAEIKGKEERLTQPGKIAIVYSQTSEANEYTEYIEYLQSEGYLENETEELELEDLQGIHGLKALRVTVNKTNSSSDNTDDTQNFKKAMKKLSLN